MIKFNELRITNDSKYLIVNATIANNYENIICDKLYIDNQDTYTLNGPSKSPIVEINLNSAKSVDLKIDLSNYNIKSNDLLFIYIVLGNTESYGIVNPYVMKTIVNLYPIYQDIMKCIREIELTCSTPEYFVDKILRLKSIDVCIRTGNYPQAIKYWNKFYK